MKKWPRPRFVEHGSPRCGGWAAPCDNTSTVPPYLHLIPFVAKLRMYKCIRSYVSSGFKFQGGEEEPRLPKRAKSWVLRNDALLPMAPKTTTTNQERETKTQTGIGVNSHASLIRVVF